MCQFYVAIPLIIVVAIITALIVWNVAISYRKKSWKQKSALLKKKLAKSSMKL